MDIELTGRSLTLDSLWRLSLRREDAVSVKFAAEVPGRVESSRSSLLSLLDRRIPVYGVSTGFGDSGSRLISAHQSEELQKNLVSYLLCGSGAVLSTEVSRAILTIRLNSLSLGLSGVSMELLQRLRLHLENDWVPVIPCEGSLGASGDLIPLAYLAQNIQGQGEAWCRGERRPMSALLQEAQVEPYTLKAKEALALVNGTSAMAGQFAINLKRARFLLEGLSRHSAWLCLALGGRTEAFSVLINEKAKRSAGQSWVAARIRSALLEEGYRSKPLGEIAVREGRTEEWVQDRYSLRCVPQILGPVHDTLELLTRWLEEEINSASDNPLMEGMELANGGGFYGGYMSQGMDYLKISLAHMADLIDRQVAYVVDEKSNRGLPANLSGASSREDSALHHGLKGLHQAVSAITSEILQKAVPGGIFSRSSESHNQDKVSLGMSAAMQCAAQLDQMFTLFTLQSVILAQALDLRGIELKGASARRYYEWIRSEVPFAERDQALDARLQKLRNRWMELSYAH